MKAALALLAVALASSGAVAYQLDDDGNGHPLYWRDNAMPVDYFLVTGNVPGGAAGEAAVQRAFAAWSEVSAHVSYRFAGFVDRGTQQLDGRNLVYWIYDEWPYDPTLAAVTFRYYDTRDGHLLDADIAFNGVRYSWSVGGTGYDIENSAAHEVGHFSGLGHSADAEATMYSRTVAGETKKRTLAEDDVAGLEAIYGGTGVAGASKPQGASSGASSGALTGGGGGCAVGGRRPAGAEALPLAALLVGLVRRRRR